MHGGDGVGVGGVGGWVSGSGGVWRLVVGAGRLDRSGVGEVGNWMGCGMKGFDSLGQGSAHSVKLSK